MSYLKRAQASQKNAKGKAFTVICGRRLSGKTTLAGTLPGTSVLLYNRLKESDTECAENLAKKLGHKLHVFNFNTVTGGELSLDDHLNALAKDTEVDNVYIDGATSVANILYDDPQVQVALEKNVWEGYRMIGDQVCSIIEKAKLLTMSSHAVKPKNVFITASLTTKTDANGNMLDVKFDIRGQMGITSLTEKAPNVLVIRDDITDSETGSEVRMMMTRTANYWPARISGLLGDENPGVMAPDLREFFKLKGSEV